MAVMMRIKGFFSKLFGKKRSRVGIYGPPNAGKPTLPNRIARDVTGEAIGPVSEAPHETRRARRKEGVEINSGGNKLLIDIVDTPGVTTKIDYHEFLEYGMDQDEAVSRAREATGGGAEAMHWLRGDNYGVIYVLDSTQGTVQHVNNMMVGII